MHIFDFFFIILNYYYKKSNCVILWTCNFMIWKFCMLMPSFSFRFSLTNDLSTFWEFWTPLFFLIGYFRNNKHFSMNINFLYRSFTRESTLVMLLTFYNCRQYQLEYFRKCFFLWQHFSIIHIHCKLYCCQKIISCTT